jgi:mono/diheme cytochrome c family protein
MESNAMSHRRIRMMLACTALFMTAHANAQDSGPDVGRTMVVSKCFQCHTDAMFRDQRQDARAWEAAIYRMVGRGGLWTPEEIKVMAEYLGSELGHGAKPAVPSR